MKKSFFALLALGVLAMGVSQAVAQHEEHAQGEHQEKADEAHAGMAMNKKAIQGEVVDITCYLRRESKGKEHIKCAEYCANLGMPLGVLEDKTNKLYLIIPPGHEEPKKQVMAFLGKKVKVNATLYTMGELTGVEIEKIEEIKQGS